MRYILNEIEYDSLDMVLDVIYYDMEDYITDDDYMGILTEGGLPIHIGNRTYETALEFMQSDYDLFEGFKDAEIQMVLSQLKADVLANTYGNIGFEIQYTDYVLMVMEDD